MDGMIDMTADEAFKILDLIKTKDVNVWFLDQMFSNEGWVRYETYEDYKRKDCDEFRAARFHVSLFPLTEEDFYLLKDWLKKD